MKYTNRFFLTILLFVNLCQPSYSLSFGDIGNVLGQSTDAKNLVLNGAKKLFTPQVLPEYPQENLDDKTISEYSSKVLKNIETNAIHKGFDVILLKTAKVNGFAYFGSQDIVVTRGLLNMMKSEAELACLLGHEIGHIDLGHDEKVYHQSYADSAQSKGIVLIGRALGQGEAADAAEYAKQNMTVANYGQQLEQDADEYGAVLAAKAGYDPYAFVDLFKRLAEKRGTNLGVHLNALTEGHKSSDVRAQHLEEFLKAKGYKPGQGFRREKEFQIAMAGLADIHTGEGGDAGKNLAGLTKDQKKDVTDLQQIDQELRENAQHGTKLKRERFLQVMKRYSEYVRKYKISRKKLLAASKEMGLNSIPAPGRKNFMDDNMDQDDPFFDPNSPDGLGPAGDFLVEGLDFVAKTALTVAAPEVMIPIMAYEAISGQDMFTGDTLTPGQRVLSGLGAFVGAGSEAVKLGEALGEMASAENGSTQIIQEANDLSGEGTQWVSRSANEVNAELKNLKNYSQPAYDPTSNVYEYQTTAEENYFRVHGPNNAEGDWLVDFDPSQYSAKELQDMLALKYPPTGYSKVIVGAGTHMRAGIAAAIKGWGNGGALQLEIADKWINVGAIFKYLGPLR